MMIADSALQRVEETEFTGNAGIRHEYRARFTMRALAPSLSGIAIALTLSVRFISVDPTTIPSASGLGWRLACDIRCIQRIWRWWAVVHGNKCLCWMPNVCTTEGFG